MSDMDGVHAIASAATEAAESVASAAGNCVDAAAMKRLITDVTSSACLIFVKRRRVHADASAASDSADASSMSDPALTGLSLEDQCHLRTSRAAHAASAVTGASDLDASTQKRVMNDVRDQHTKRLKTMPVVFVPDAVPETCGGLPRAGEVAQHQGFDRVWPCQVSRQCHQLL